MSENNPITSEESRARLAFRQLTNGLYLKPTTTQEVEPFFESFLSCVKQGVSDLIALELYAMWERLKLQYEAIRSSRTALEIEKHLRLGAARYLGVPA